MGTRQVGKTYLVKKLFSEGYKVVSTPQANGDTWYTVGAE